MTAAIEAERERLATLIEYVRQQTAKAEAHAAAGRAENARLALEDAQTDIRAFLEMDKR